MFTYEILLPASAFLGMLFVLFIVGAERRKINLPWRLIASSMMIALIVFLVATVVDDGNLAWMAVATNFLAAAWISSYSADRAHYARKLERAV